MFTYYDDILSRISIQPTWWDENRVPRFCDFHPSKLANIYATEAALIVIAHQLGPIHHLRVAMSVTSQVNNILAESILAKQMCYGDPPVARYCAAPDMNAVEIQVLEYWKRTGGRNWIRDQTLEINQLRPGWEGYRKTSGTQEA